MRRTGAPSPVAEDPEEGATLAKLFTSLLSPFDPETESLAEYEERLQQGVEMARLDCRDEAVSLAESCLGEAQFQTAYSRFSNLCRMSPAAARPDGPDHVLRAIGAGITKLLQMPEAPTLWLCTTGTRVPGRRMRRLVGPTLRVVYKLGCYLFVRKPRPLRMLVAFHRARQLQFAPPTTGCGRTVG